MEGIVEEIKRKVDIVEYIGSFVTLKKAGRNFKGVCPFHQEKTPSFVVSPERQIWHCFGSCGDGGDVIKFLMKWENLTFMEAIREFAQKLHIELKDMRQDDQAVQKKDRLVSANRMAADFYHHILLKTEFGETARSYLAGRGIRPAIVETFELGYAPSSWDSLRRYLNGKKFNDAELAECGLLIRSDKGSYYDRFRGRLIFPLKDARGVIIGFSGRILSSGVKEAKYVNTPETPLYRKRETLFGLHLVKEGIKKHNAVIVTEGEFDMITPYQAGVDNIVAIKGAALTREQLYLMKRYTKRVYLALDADAAGEEAMKRGIEEAEKMDFELGVIQFTLGKDPDEALKTDPVAFKKAVESPVPIYDFLIDAFMRKYPGSDAFSKKGIAEGLAPFFGYISNPIVRSHYVKKLSALLGVSEGSVEHLLRSKVFIPREERVHLGAGKQVEMKREEIVQKQFMSLLLQSEERFKIVNTVGDVLIAEDFPFPAYGKIFMALKKVSQEGGRFDVNSFSASLPEELRSVCDELYLYGSTDMVSDVRNLTRLGYEIRANSLKKQIAVILKQEDSAASELQLTTLNNSLKEVEKRAVKV